MGMDQLIGLRVCILTPTYVEEFLKNNYMHKYQCTETSYNKICKTLTVINLKMSY